MIAVACADDAGPLTIHDLSGQWENSKGGIIELRAGGSLFVSEFPVGWHTSSTGGARLTSPGSWRYEDTTRDVHLSIDRGPDGLTGFACTVSVRGAGKDARLYTYLGDPDSEPRYYFDRVP